MLVEPMPIPASYRDGSHVNVASQVACTEAEGPGRRYALWVQGCPLRCPGCCNPHMLAFDDASWRPVEDVASAICETPDIEGVTFIGGEPFAQARALSQVAATVRAAGLSVMVFTGLTLTQIKASDDPAYEALLAQIDLLVDGPYIQKQHVDDRRWIGSANQAIHVLTERYEHLRESEQGWDQGANTIELRLKDGEISINGFPHERVTEILEQMTRIAEAKRKRRQPRQEGGAG